MLQISTGHRFLEMAIKKDRPYRTQSTNQHWANLNAIPYQYWFINWFMSIFFTCQKCVHTEFTMLRIAPILIIYLSNLVKFWFHKGQDCANSDFSIAILAPIVIFYLTDLGKFWFYKGQTFANCDFSHATLGLIQIFFLEKGSKNSRKNAIKFTVLTAN